MSLKRLTIYLLSGFFLISCSSEDKDVMFTRVLDSGIDFINRVQDTDSLNIINYRNFYNGGGVATGDINNDGLVDIFFTANQSANKLYLNKGNWKFEDISASAGFTDKKQFSTGVVMADINADGWLDIYVCNAGNMGDSNLRKNQLFINNKNLGFTEEAEKYGLAWAGYSTQSSFFDYDRDGDLDCFLIDNSPVEVSGLGYPRMRHVPAKEWKVDERFKGGGDHLFRNDNGYFKDVSREMGIHGTLMSFGLGVSVGDFNGDAQPDIFVANDFFERDYLYIKQGDGTYRDELESRMQHTSYASMGSDVGDINNDGYPDIFTTDMLPADDYRLKTTLRFDNIDLYRMRSENGFYHQFLQNTLQLNDRNGNFQDIANYSGVNASEWSWGALIFDADNDGYNDLYVCNGIYRDLTNQDFLDFDADLIRQQVIATGKKDIQALVSKIPSIAVPNKLFRNKGNLQFEDIGEKWGFRENSFSNGAAYADLDNDGDLDLVVNNVNEPAFIFKNLAQEKSGNSFIGFDLRFIEKNPFAIGAKIEIKTDNGILTRELFPSRGFQSSVDYRLCFGLGKNKTIRSMAITWPNGGKLILPPKEPGRYHRIAYNDSSLVYNLANIYFPITDLDTTLTPHRENAITDFYAERAIPVMLSKPGPVAAVGDVNGDGEEDVYIGGAEGQTGQLYLQQKNGKLIPSPQKAFESFTDFEDGAALFFDGDGDGDRDLFLGAAGNTATPGSRPLQHRYFVNDGKGNFIISPTAFPLNQDNISVAVAHDFDSDGDLDLFVGARNVTGNYGLTPASRIYINNGQGKFSELPEDKAGGITKIGMVTDAVWANMDRSKDLELVVVGEWMAPALFKWKNGKFESIKTGLENEKGWWQAVVAADLNGDGLQELVLGNYGKNFYLRPTKEEPVKLWVNDFDKNGSVDKILTRSINGQDKPVFTKHDLESMLPSLKKQNLRNVEFASRAIQDLLPGDQLKGSLVREVNQTATGVVFNKGNGVFIFEELPDKTQLTSAKAILVDQLFSKGKPDILLAGNEFDFQPQLGRLDAGSGDVVLQSGSVPSNWEHRSLEVNQLKNMVRGVKIIKGTSGERILFLINNNRPLLIRKENLDE